MSQGIEVAANPLAVFQQLPEADDFRERRRDWVRAAYIGLLAVLFASVIVFACCANQFWGLGEGEGVVDDHPAGLDGVDWGGDGVLLQESRKLRAYEACGDWRRDVLTARSRVGYNCVHRKIHLLFYSWEQSV